MSTMPVLHGFSATLCEKLPTTLPCSNNIMCITTTWFLEISAESRVILRYPVQIPELGIPTRATLLFCSTETSSGCSPFFVCDHLLELSALEQIFHKRGSTCSFPKKKICSRIFIKIHMEDHQLLQEVCGSEHLEVKRITLAVQQRLYRKVAPSRQQYKTYRGKYQPLLAGSKPLLNSPCRTTRNTIAMKKIY